MDLASIEQILGCWAGAAIYGNPMRTPSLLPVGDRRLSEIALTLPPDYRREGGFYRDVMDALHPALGAIPFNKAVGLNRLRYWRQELRELTPSWVKRAIKPFR